MSGTSDAGRTLVFVYTDGSEQSVELEGKNIVLDKTAYRLNGADELWRAACRDQKQLTKLGVYGMSELRFCPACGAQLPRVAGVRYDFARDRRPT